MEKTLNSPLSDAELCRRNGWTAGTRLVGDEGAGPTTIEITAIGEQRILAKTLSPVAHGESSWVLRCRKWSVVGVAELNPWAGVIMAELDRVRAQLAAQADVMTAATKLRDYWRGVANNTTPQSPGDEYHLMSAVALAVDLAGRNET